MIYSATPGDPQTPSGDSLKQRKTPSLRLCPIENVSKCLGHPMQETLILEVLQAIPTFLVRRSVSPVIPMF